MPNCYYCGEGTPITNFYFIRKYSDMEMHGWSFCSYDHMKEWVLTHEFCSICEQIKKDEEMYEGILCFACKDTIDRRDIAEEIRRRGR